MTHFMVHSSNILLLSIPRIPRNSIDIDDSSENKDVVDNENLKYLRVEQAMADLAAALNAKFEASLEIKNGLSGCEGVIAIIFSAAAFRFSIF